jgi:PadR family transcriptional regulator, regulatory protein PadR
MPGGRGFRGGHGGGRRKMFFLESCLMVLLLKEAGYGYNLMAGLTDFGFQIDEMDISIIYRALRDLETAELVSSSWDENSLGPQRRVYTLTPQGEMTLEKWLDSLRQRRKEIEALEAAYDALKNNK